MITQNRKQDKKPKLFRRITKRLKKLLALTEPKVRIREVGRTNNQRNRDKRFSRRMRGIK
jgi:hypothetical protein